MSRPRPIGIAAGVVAAVAVAAGLAGSGPATAAGAPPAAPTTVDLHDPVGLPLGDPPAVASMVAVRGGPIYRPGEAALPVDGNDVRSLLVQARGGYLVTLDQHRVRFVSDSGSQYDVFASAAPRRWFIRDVTTSHDGRYAAVTLEDVSGPHPRYRIVVRRITGPRTIAARTFDRSVRVASLTAHRALLTPGLQAHHRVDRRFATRWWNFHTNRLRTIDAEGRIGPDSDFGGISVGDLSAGQVSLMRGDHNRVQPLPSRGGRAWHTRAHEWVISWSPDDRYVLTAGWTPQKPRTGNGWDALTLRRARDGKVVTVFKGFQNLSGGPTSPTWENDTTFVAGVYDTCDHGSCANLHDIRCTLHGPCERVLISGLPVGYSSVEERRLPSS